VIRNPARLAALARGEPIDAPPHEAV